jgi:hypothetical protein
LAIDTGLEVGVPHLVVFIEPGTRGKSTFITDAGTTGKNIPLLASLRKFAIAEW